MYHFWWRRKFLERVLPNSSHEERKQVPFICEAFIATWKKLSVLASVVHTLPQQGSGFKTQGFLLELEQVWTLSSHIPGGRSRHTLRLCLHHLTEGAMQPDQREGWKGRTYPQPCNQVTAPSTAAALLSLLRAVKSQIHVHCKAQGGGSQVCPAPGREGQTGKHRPVWAELPRCRVADQVEGIRCSWHSLAQCLTGTGVWTNGEEEWPGFVCQFFLQIACALSLALLSFLKMLIKKKKKTKKPSTNKIRNLNWYLLCVFYKSSICK